MTKQQQLELIQQNERLTKAVNDRAKTIKELRKQLNEQKELLAGLNRAADALMAALAVSFGEKQEDGSYILRMSYDAFESSRGMAVATAKDETAHEIVTRAWRTEVPDGVN